MTNYRGELRDNPPPRQIFSVEQQMQPHIIESVIDRSLEVVLFAEDLSRRRSCSNVDETTVLPMTQTLSSLRLERTDYVSVVKNTESKSDLNSTKLSNVFGISEGLAVKTMAAATRMCPRNTCDITLNMRYSTNDRM